MDDLVPHRHVRGDERRVSPLSGDPRRLCRQAELDGGRLGRAVSVDPLDGEPDAADADYPRFGRDDLPVVLVSWFEATAYGRWLTRTLGRGRWLYRMPTEGEWEKAARGPDGFDYGLGMELSEPQVRLYNWKKNPGAAVTLVGAGERRLAIARTATASSTRPGTPASGPRASRALTAGWRPIATTTGTATTLPAYASPRGGSWYSATVSRLALAYREEFQPELPSNDLGFRVAAFALP